MLTETNREVRHQVTATTRECPERSVGTAKLLVSDTRSFLRFLFAAGWTSVDLSTAVPGVAGWRGAALPKAVASEMVAALLAGCDRTTVAGRRDYAVLVLLSRLGLRAGEVAGLCLEDIDWDAGEITVTGKGVRVERLPLPADVGEAIVGYLAHGRRPTTDRNVFLRLLAPHGPMTRGAVQGVVGQACERAGIERFGPHRLRHSAATDMLGAGAALAEVGQVLRHRSMSTTAIYAKCDLEALRSLAMVWPGGAR
jgi:integrase/recombinase XerD